MGKKKVLITAALPYANGPLHFGHIIGAYLPGDAHARFRRLQGEEVLYICGSDEYGVAITLSAELAKRSPREHVDHFHALHQQFFSKMQISFDYYGRTSAEGHVEETQKFFFALQKKGKIEAKTENHLYSEKEGRFLADRYVSGTCPKCGYAAARGDECPSCAASYEATDLKNPTSKLTGSPLVLRPSEHLYLRFDLFQKELREWLSKKNWKSSVLAFAQSYVDDLKPRAITRDSSWGVAVPHMPHKVFYVWFDAPIGYISITQEWAKKRGTPKKWEDFWLDSRTELVQFLGKDNIPFHAVFFPAMLMGQDLPYKLPDALPANEFLLLEGRQFSKSDGWTIDTDAFFAKYSSDQARYALAANAPETGDAEFSWKEFQTRCNSELLGKFGNFIHRVFVFIEQRLGGVVPPRGKVGEEFLLELRQLVARAQEEYRAFSLRKVCHTLMEIAQAGNGYFDSQKPWVLVKDEAKLPQLQGVLAASLECCKLLSLVAFPIIPEAAEKIWAMLGHTGTLSQATWDDIVKTPLQEGKKLEVSKPLFRKIEDEEIEKELSQLHAASKEKSVPALDPWKKEISFEDFSKIDLRVGKILSAKSVPKSKKLFELQVDLGGEERTIVSGIAEHYTPEALLGKQILVVANLSPIKIMGIESRGMILAAHLGGKLELPGVETLLPGSSVT